MGKKNNQYFSMAAAMILVPLAKVVVSGLINKFSNRLEYDPNARDSQGYMPNSGGCRRSGSSGQNFQGGMPSSDNWSQVGRAVSDIISGIRWK